MLMSARSHLAGNHQADQGLDTAVAIDRTGTGARVALTGELLLEAVDRLRADFDAIAGPGPITVDARGLSALDTAGAWAIVTLRDRLKAEGVEVAIEGLADTQTALLDPSRTACRSPSPRRPARPAGSSGSPVSARA